MGAETQALRELIVMLKEQNVAYYKTKDVELIFNAEPLVPMAPRKSLGLATEEAEVQEEPAVEQVLPDSYYDPSLWPNGKVPGFLTKRK